MTIAYVDAAQNSGTGTAASCNMPSHSSGDIAFFQVLSSGAAQVFNTPGGWTECVDSTLKIGTETYNPECALFYRVLGGSEPGSYTCTLDVSRDWKTAISVWSGQDASPFDDIVGAVGSVGSTQYTPTVTNSDSNNWHLCFMFTHNRYVTAVPTGYVERITSSDTTFDFSIFDSDGGIATGSVQEAYTISGYDYGAGWAVMLQVASATGGAIPVIQHHRQQQGASQ